MNDTFSQHLEVLKSLSVDNASRGINVLAETFLPKHPASSILNHHQIYLDQLKVSLLKQLEEHLSNFNLGISLSSQSFVLENLSQIHSLLSTIPSSSTLSQSLELLSSVTCIKSDLDFCTNLFSSLSLPSDVLKTLRVFPTSLTLTSYLKAVEVLRDKVEQVNEIQEDSTSSLISTVANQLKILLNSCEQRLGDYVSKNLIGNQIEPFLSILSVLSSNVDIFVESIDSVIDSKRKAINQSLEKFFNQSFSRALAFVHELAEFNFHFFNSLFGNFQNSKILLDRIMSEITQKSNLLNHFKIVLVTCKGSNNDLSFDSQSKIDWSFVVKNFDLELMIIELLCHFSIKMDRLHCGDLLSLSRDTALQSFCSIKFLIANVSTHFPALLLSSNSDIVFLRIVNTISSLLLLNSEIFEANFSSDLQSILPNFVENFVTTLVTLSTRSLENSVMITSSVSLIIRNLSVIDSHDVISDCHHRLLITLPVLIQTVERHCLLTSLEKLNISPYFSLLNSDEEFANSIDLIKVVVIKALKNINSTKKFPFPYDVTSKLPENIRVAVHTGFVETFTDVLNKFIKKINKISGDDISEINCVY
ncbi:hypothetical protein RCL1_006372 [Eukaryota sp. TZLM3-RCL]